MNPIAAFIDRYRNGPALREAQAEVLAAYAKVAALQGQLHELSQHYEHEHRRAELMDELIRAGVKVRCRVCSTQTWHWAAPLVDGHPFPMCKDCLQQSKREAEAAAKAMAKEAAPVAVEHQVEQPADQQPEPTPTLATGESAA